MKQIYKILMLLSMLALSGCSVNHDAVRQSPAAGFSYRHTDFDYKVAWNTTQAENEVVIDGILKNVRYTNIEQLDLTIFLRGPDGKLRARVTTIPFPQQSKIDEVASFSAQMHNITIKQGDTLQFLIHYLGTEGAGGGIDWISTFSADALTGASHHHDRVKAGDW